MIITKDNHYLARVYGKMEAVWRVLCCSCLMRAHFNAVDGFQVEVLSYSRLNCEVCGVSWSQPQGRLPNLKTRHVVYVIHADYPEWDMTA